jgi:hypothetical protein
MADGSVRAAGAVGGGDLLRGEGVLVAVCGDPSCGAQAVLAGPGAWPPALRRASVGRLEAALRCGCGARGGVLRVLGDCAPRAAGRGGVYLFVV